MVAGGPSVCVRVFVKVCLGVSAQGAVMQVVVLRICDWTDVPNVFSTHTVFALEG